MGLLGLLFGCSNNSQDKQVEKKEKTPIQTLAYAISDVGLWTWWTTDSNKSVQLEFDRAMLFIENPENKEKPSNRLALRFLNPKSVTILYKKESKLPKNWLELFEKDKLEPFSVDYENFSFDKEQVSKILASADSTETIIGEKYNDKTNGTCRLGFWAGEIGIVIVADTMKIVEHSGQIDLNKIPELHQKWWGYWKKYWDLKDTKSPLPYDPLCEITIPATKDNIEKVKTNLDKQK